MTIALGGIGGVSVDHATAYCSLHSLFFKLWEGCPCCMQGMQRYNTNITEMASVRADPIPIDKNNKNIKINRRKLLLIKRK